MKKCWISFSVILLLLLSSCGTGLESAQVPEQNDSLKEPSPAFDSVQTYTDTDGGVQEQAEIVEENQESVVPIDLNQY